MSAALEARAAGLSFVVIEAAEPFATLVNFPKEKPIYTYPTDMEPAGQIRFKSEVKEPLLAELKAQTVDAGIETLNAPRRTRGKKRRHLCSNDFQGRKY